MVAWRANKHLSPSHEGLWLFLISLTSLTLGFYNAIMIKQFVTPNRSLTEETEAKLNQQILMEGLSSARYLSMASWCDTKGYVKSAEFLYRHSEEERQHMLTSMTREDMQFNLKLPI